MQNIVWDMIEQLQKEYQVYNEKPVPEIPREALNLPAKDWKSRARLDCWVNKTDNLYASQETRIRSLLYLENQERARHDELPLLFSQGRIMEQETAADGTVTQAPLRARGATPTIATRRTARNVTKVTVDGESEEESGSEMTPPSVSTVPNKDREESMEPLDIEEPAADTDEEYGTKKRKLKFKKPVRSVRGRSASAQPAEKPVSKPSLLKPIEKPVEKSIVEKIVEKHVDKSDEKLMVPLAAPKKVIPAPKLVQKPVEQPINQAQREATLAEVVNHLTSGVRNPDAKSSHFTAKLLGTSLGLPMSPDKKRKRRESSSPDESGSDAGW